MPDENPQEPWEQLEVLLGQSDSEGLHAYLDALPPGEAARAISRLSWEDQGRLFTLLPPREAADLLAEMSPTQAASFLPLLEPARSAALLALLPSDERADLVGELDQEQANAILASLTPEVAEDLRQLTRYPADTAGGVMVTEYLAYPQSYRVADVLDNLRNRAAEYARYAVQYAYVTAEGGKLVGVLRLRDLLLSPPETPVTSVMIPQPLRVRVDTPLDELLRFFDRHPFFGVPVTDADDRLVGVVLREDVEEAGGEQAERWFLLASGVLGGEELRSMPWRARLYRRLAWLAISAVLNLLAASVVGFYQDTLSAVIALAVFLPVISGMGGNSGNQALAVSIRELALGLVKPHEYTWVLLKEMGIGLINGLVLGLLLGTVAFVWKGNLYLALVVMAAMTLSTLVAVCLGGTLPLLLKRMKLDPALASGPILTTVTDVCGFFFALTLASALLHKLSLV